jgi:hypothetical protein
MRRGPARLHAPPARGRACAGRARRGGAGHARARGPPRREVGGPQSVGRRRPGPAPLSSANAAWCRSAGSLGRVFDHVAIAVSDLAASERFYRTVLGVLGTEPSHADAELVEWEDWDIGATDREHPVTAGSTSASALATARRSTRSGRRVSTRVTATTAHRGRARSTARRTTAGSCSTPMGPAICRVGSWAVFAAPFDAAAPPQADRPVRRRRQTRVRPPSDRRARGGGLPCRKRRAARRSAPRLRQAVPRSR